MTRLDQCATCHAHAPYYDAGGRHLCGICYRCGTPSAATLTRALNALVDALAIREAVESALDVEAPAYCITCGRAVPMDDAVFGDDDENGDPMAWCPEHAP